MKFMFKGPNGGLQQPGTTKYGTRKQKPVSLKVTTTQRNADKQAISTTFAISYVQCMYSSYM